MSRCSKALLGAALALAMGAIPAMAAGIVPISGTQQFDNTSSPPAFLNGGKLYVYQTGTTTCAPAYSNFTLTTPLACPIILNSAGRVPAIYAADGSVRLRLLNSADVLQFDEDNVAIVTAASTGSSTPIPDSTQIFGTRDLKVRFDDQPLPGYVRMNGRTIGSATSGASERANNDTQSLFLELWTFANISVVTGKGASAAADWAANKQLTLPDMRGKILAAMNDMGAGACSSNCITSATVTSPGVAGQSGGTETKTIAQVNIPNYNLSAGSLGISDTRTWGTTQNPIINVGSGGTITSTGAGSFWSATNPAVVSVTSGTISVTGNVPSGGSGTAMGITPPVMMLMFYVKL